MSDHREVKAPIICSALSRYSSMRLFHRLELCLRFEFVELIGDSFTASISARSCRNFKLNSLTCFILPEACAFLPADACQYFSAFADCIHSSRARAEVLNPAVSLWVLIRIHRYRASLFPVQVLRRNSLSIA